MKAPRTAFFCDLRGFLCLGGIITHRSGESRAERTKRARGCVACLHCVRALCLLRACIHARAFALCSCYVGVSRLLRLGTQAGEKYNARTREQETHTHLHALCTPKHTHPPTPPPIYKGEGGGRWTRARKRARNCRKICVKISSKNYAFFLLRF